jgi:hypothetical protein
MSVKNVDLDVEGRRKKDGKNAEEKISRWGKEVKKNVKGCKARVKSSDVCESE